jgi:hypothetical protein
MLTQLATVKARLEIAPATTTYDDLLTRAIQAASARFDRNCGRALARAVGATQEFGATDTEIIATRYPIETVTKFELKNNEAEPSIRNPAPLDSVDVTKQTFGWNRSDEV